MRAGGEMGRSGAELITNDDGYGLGRGRVCEGDRQGCEGNGRLSGEGALGRRELLTLDGPGGDSSHSSLQLSAGEDRRLCTAFAGEEEWSSKSPSSSQFSAVFRREGRGVLVVQGIGSDAVEPL